MKLEIAVLVLDSIVSRPARALWIEIISLISCGDCVRSRPARALWIEIHHLALVFLVQHVEAREGLVD